MPRSHRDMKGEVAKGLTDARTRSSVELGGYQQELKRTLGSFQVFAVSFAFISVAVGVFATYDDVLHDGGPVAIWLWVVVAIGQVLVALVLAQFAARIAPRPLLILHSATDTVTNYDEAFAFVRHARPPVELHLLHGPTHFMFVNPDPRVADTLRGWLERYFPSRR